MTNKLSLYINFIIIFTLFLLFCLLQTTTLSQFMQASQTPNLWIAFTVYIALFRKLPEGLFWVYLSSLTGTIFSHCPLSFFLISQIIILFCVRTMSVFWKGGRYFLIFYSSSIILFYMSNYLLSLSLNLQVLHEVHWSSFFYQTLWAIILGYPIYLILKWIDELTRQGVSSLTDKDDLTLTT